MTVEAEKKQKPPREIAAEYARNATFRSLFGSRVNIGRFNDNSFFVDFVNGKEWACVIKFPHEPSERAIFVRKMFEDIVLPNLGAESITNEEDYGGLLGTEATSDCLAFVNYQGGNPRLKPRRDNEESKEYVQRHLEDGESLSFVLYQTIDGVTDEVAFADDSIFFEDITDDPVIAFANWLKKNGIYVALRPGLRPTQNAAKPKPKDP